MAQLAAELHEQHELWGVAIHHRVGRVEIGEPSVVVAVSAAHREAALAACKEAIDTLAGTVPLWKKEVTRAARMDSPAAAREGVGRLRERSRPARDSHPSITTLPSRLLPVVTAFAVVDLLRSCFCLRSYGFFCADHAREPNPRFWESFCSAEATAWFVPLDLALRVERSALPELSPAFTSPPAVLWRVPVTAFCLSSPSSPPTARCSPTELRPGTAGAARCGPRSRSHGGPRTTASWPERRPASAPDPARCRRRRWRPSTWPPSSPSGCAGSEPASMSPRGGVDRRVPVDSVLLADRLRVVRPLLGVRYLEPSCADRVRHSPGACTTSRRRHPGSPSGARWCSASFRRLRLELGVGGLVRRARAG